MTQERETMDSLSILFDPAMFEPGCKQPSRLFPVVLEFTRFQAKCQALGFDREEVLKLAMALAERELKGLADGA
ncbi:hypothetical protein [Mesorhizobium silamurunense]|uniref:hypothetical protein n=1 Tax=Mesorhizobium silamurunense TaxID=499528 RepID=UPI001784EAEB|nr:hypothetical protein [Mesorhizobium silamurunense]